METKVWQSIDEATNYVKKLCDDCYHPMRIDNKTSVSAYNKKTKGEAFHITDILPSRMSW